MTNNRFEVKKRIIATRMPIKTIQGGREGQLSFDGKFTSNKNLSMSGSIVSTIVAGD